jgi:hypothetical protein
MLFSVVRTSLSLAVTLRKAGQVELQGETPKQLRAIEACQKLQYSVKQKQCRASSYIELRPTRAETQPYHMALSRTFADVSFPS